MKNANCTSEGLNVNLLTDTSPSTCDPMLRDAIEQGHGMLALLVGTSLRNHRPKDGKSRDGNA